MNDLSQRIINQTYKETVNLLDFMVDDANVTTARPADIVILKAMLNNLRSWVWTDMNSTLVFCVSRYLEGGMDYRLIALRPAGLILYSSSPKSKETIVFSQNRPTVECDKKDLDLFFQEFRGYVKASDDIITYEAIYDKHISMNDEATDVISARLYTRNEIKSLIKLLILSFDQIRMSGPDLVVLSKIYMLLEAPWQFKVYSTLLCKLTIWFEHGQAYEYEITYDHRGLGLLLEGRIFTSDLVFGIDIVDRMRGLVHNIREHISRQWELYIVTSEYGDGIHLIE